MDTFEKLKDFITGKPWYIKILIITLVGIIAYFSTGCAYKFHADNIDNITREFSIKIPIKE